MSGGNAPIVTNVEKYDGTSWSNDTAVPTGKSKTTGAGTTTAGIMIGGLSPTTATFHYTGGGSALTKTLSTE